MRSEKLTERKGVLVGVNSGASMCASVTHVPQALNCQGPADDAGYIALVIVCPNGEASASHTRANLSWFCAKGAVLLARTGPVRS